jgi:ubiquinone/menaquinone biosynthesis C-methylase UbiE
MPVAKTCDFDGSVESPQRKELVFWEALRKSGDEVDLKLARDLPDDAPVFILRMLTEFEMEAAEFCFGGAGGLVLDAGCGNGNLLLRALEKENGAKAKKADSKVATRLVGMDFSCNMLRRAASRTAVASRAKGECSADFFQGSVTCLPFRDRSFDWLVSSGVLTCLPSPQDATGALREFHRVLKPGGVLVVDFFNSASHFTLVRKHLFREAINPPEYVSPSDFLAELQDAGFQIITYRGFDFKPYQGYLFMSRWQKLVDPFFFQERLSRFIETKVVPRLPWLSLFGYRIYVKCVGK